MIRWRQLIAVRGNALRLLQSASDIITSDGSNTVIVRGDGAYFPEIRGVEWAAMCTARKANDVELSDIAPILQLLLDATPIVFADSDTDEDVTGPCGQESGQ